jgi:hypothetical protein
MELIDIITAVAIGALLGVGAVGIYVWVLYQKIRHSIDQMINEVIQEAEADLIGLDIEVDNGVYFCYNNTDKQFICQGNTVAEIKQAFRERFPTKTAYLASGNPEVVEHFKTELLKLGTNENSTSQ